MSIVRSQKTTAAPQAHEAEADSAGGFGRDRTGVLHTVSVGIPVHAVLTPRDYPAPEAVLKLLKSAQSATVLVTFVNPATVLLAQQSATFARSLNSFDLVLPDGIGMCIAIQWLHGLPARRVSFDMTSLGPTMFEHARQGGLSVALVGGEPGVAARARDRIVAHYPGLKITGEFDGFTDMATAIQHIVALRPDILICGMGGVKQAAFLLNARAEGWSGWGFTCGGFFDQLQDGMNYYPRWVDRANLRWAYRLIREPGRLWRRYLIEYSKFGLMLWAARVRR